MRQRGIDVDDDPFERMLEREAEIRRRLEAGDIDDEEARELRDLAGHSEDDGGSGGSRLRLTLDQIARIADEGAEPAVVHALVRLSDRLSVDDAIDLAVEYWPERSSVIALAASGIGNLDRDQITALWDTDVDADTIAAAVAYGIQNPTDGAVALTECADDPSGLLRELIALDLRGLDVTEIEELAENGIEPAALARMLAACPELPISTAIKLCVEEIDPDALTSLHEEGIEIDTDRLTRSSPAVSLLNVRVGGRQILVGGGRQRIRRSGRVDGFFVGDLTVNPGLTVELGATLFGDLHIEPGARVVLRGRVTGTVHNLGILDDGSVTT